MIGSKSANTFRVQGEAQAPNPKFYIFFSNLADLRAYLTLVNVPTFGKWNCMLY